MTRLEGGAHIYASIVSLLEPRHLDVDVCIVGRTNLCSHVGVVEPLGLHAPVGSNGEHLSWTDRELSGQKIE